ncbi:hypothetical protein I7I50_03220 [Histoplasma capsulatum G186AR]|nr:hypothetical protein I7I52_00111 [Histoplasma capsulatum]QSS72147.1 hypothetical protein I7I50_03220 [Histoplasma capsulatum G186AR]
MRLRTTTTMTASNLPACQTAPRAWASGVQWPTSTPHRCQGAEEQQANSTLGGLTGNVQVGLSETFSCHVMSCHVMGGGTFADWTIERPGSQRVGGEKQASDDAGPAAGQREAGRRCCVTWRC